MSRFRLELQLEQNQHKRNRWIVSHSIAKFIFNKFQRFEIWTMLIYGKKTWILYDINLAYSP